MNKISRLKLIKFAWFTFFWANWVLIAVFWSRSSINLLWESLPLTLVAIGRLLGLSGAYLVLTQFFLMGRTPVIEGVFGLDKLARLHEKNGKRALIVLLLHPSFLIYGYALYADISLLQQFKQFVFGYEYVSLAVLSLVLFSLVGAVSLTITRLKLKYETWYLVHLLVYGAVFLSFFHQIKIGPTLSTENIFYWYWIILYAGVGITHLLYRFITPIYRTWRYDLRVEKIIPETYNVNSIYMVGRKLDAFPALPGQFMFFRFLEKGFWKERHPFSISGASRDYLRISIKELGDFTKRIKTLKPGTRVVIEGPYGVFTQKYSASDKLLFIAGGIGITPIRPLAEKCLDSKRDVILLYSNRTEKDIVFKDELEALKGKGGKIYHILSQEPDFEGERGVLDEDMIFRLVPDAKDREIFVCGPPAMIDAVLAILSKNNIPQGKIHFEKFSLYD